MSNTLSVFILHRNHSDNVIETFNDLKKQSFQDFHVNIIDDHSDVDELAKLKAIKDEKLFVYSYPSPFKFGNDNNYRMGLELASKGNCKYAYMLQDDMKINSKDLLIKLVGFMDNNPFCGAACPTLYTSGEITWGPGIAKERMGIMYNINETMITRVSLIEKMNFIPKNLIYYGHEYYINNWLKMHGYFTSPVGGVNVTHYGGGTSTKFWDEKYYYRPRTTIMIMRMFHRHISLRRKIQYFREEIWEIKGKLLECKRKRDISNLLKYSFILLKGIVVGLLIPLNINQ